MKIVKHSGDIVDFNRDKLKLSLFKSGASQSLVDAILHKIEEEIYEGIPTKKIYKLAFELLKKVSKPQAARYNLRTALQLLGPTGFFFEKYIAKLFEFENYQVKTNLILQGKCVSHEIDIVVKKRAEISMVECKFHGGKDSSSDVKVPMYILSRFNDIKDGMHSVFSEKDKITSCFIVTNNRFTTDAINFANCSGLQLLSWDYPLDDNLSVKIEKSQLYPVTCLSTLSTLEKEELLNLDVILVKELMHDSTPLEKIGLSPTRIKNILKEVSELCKYLERYEN